MCSVFLLISGKEGGEGRGKRREEEGELRNVREISHCILYQTSEFIRHLRMSRSSHICMHASLEPTNRPCIAATKCHPLSLCPRLPRLVFGAGNSDNSVVSPTPIDLPGSLLACFDISCQEMFTLVYSRPLTTIRWVAC